MRLLDITQVPLTLEVNGGLLPPPDEGAGVGALEGAAVGAGVGAGAGVLVAAAIGVGHGTLGNVTEAGK
ncbi:MAG: hypothetical protein JO166_00870 [Deltaproteobacteria bacterium]|nr:hypothetical protein [Deltaproteobacteria bacterium]